MRSISPRIILFALLACLSTTARADVCHKFGPLLPSTCTVGECFQLTVIPRGFYDCKVTDVWTVWGLDPIDDSVQMANGDQWVSRIVPDCSGPGKALSYNSSTNSFFCTTITVVATKTADQSSTSTTFADVTGLTFPVAANTSYALLCEMSYITAAPNTALQVSLNGPAAPTAIAWTVTTAISTPSSHHQYQNTYEATANPATAQNPPGALPCRIAGTIENGPNAGTLAVRFRSEVAASFVTIQRGAFCILRPS